MKGMGNMNLVKSSNWVTLFFCGGIAIVLSWLASGCRWGNQESSPASPPEAADPYEGYYNLTPKSLSYQATLNSAVEGTLTPKQDNLPLSYMPELLAVYLTNPVYLVSGGNPKQGNYGLMPAHHPEYGAIPIDLYTDGSLSFEGTGSPFVVWKDPNCLSHIEITESGKLYQNASSQDGIMGRIELAVMVVTKFQGNCEATLQTVATCYQDSSACPVDPKKDGQLQLLLETMDALVQTKVIQPSEISRLSDYTYTATYE